MPAAHGSLAWSGCSDHWLGCVCRFSSAISDQVLSRVCQILQGCGLPWKQFAVPCNHPCELIAVDLHCASQGPDLPAWA